MTSHHSLNSLLRPLAFLLVVTLSLSACGGGASDETPHDAAHFLNLARGEVDVGQYVIAATLLDQALALEPENMDAMLLKAQVLAAQNDFLGAALAWEQVSRLDASNLGAFMSSADNYMRAGQTDLSIDAYGAALAQRPDHAPAYAGRGTVRRGDGDAAGAIADLNKAIALNPGLSAAFRERGLAHFALQDTERALSDLDRALSLDSLDALAYASRGVIYASEGQFPQAVGDLDQAIRLQPANADHYGNRGAAYGSLGRHVDAIRDFSAAIELAPNESLHYVGRGQGYLELSQVARADADFESAIDLNSINPTAYAFRAVSQSLLGDHVAAAAAANRAEELGFPGGLIGTLITAYTEQISANDK